MPKIINTSNKIRPLSQDGDKKRSTISVKVESHFFNYVYNINYTF